MRVAISALMCAVLSLGTSAAMAASANKAPAKNTTSKAAAKKTAVKSKANKSAQSKQPRIPAPLSQSAQDAAEASASDRELDAQEQKFAKWVD